MKRNSIPANRYPRALAALWLLIATALCLCVLPSAFGADGAAAARPASAARASAELDSMDALDDRRTLNTGDTVSLRIVQDQEEPKRLVVTPSGELEVPYIGRYQAAGKTCKQLAHELRRELEKEYYYTATVIVAIDELNPSRGKVYLVGLIRTPGPLDIPNGEPLTVSKAIMSVGGFTDFADRKRVRVTREGGSHKKAQVTVVNVAEIIERGRTQYDLELEPGDVVFVPARLFNF